MGKVKSGFSKQTKENLLTGAGAFFKNFNVGVDTYESAKEAGKLIGATQGGGEFKAVATVRQIEADGVAGKAKGLELIDSWEVSQSMSLLETTPETIKLALGAADIDISSNGEYEIISGRSEIKDEDYLDNLTYIGTITGSDTPVIIQIFNALSTDGLNIKTEDKKEAVLGITVYGHYTEDDLDSPPYRIYYPKKKNVATPVANVKGGTYTESKSITLSTSTEGATIKYTTNGFEPTSKDTTYSTAITVDKNTILKAKAFKSGVPDSLTLTETYIIETN
ncbi:chitobiase/beta-hexosaminidase C-terminal domain-containing protein [Clostridium tertium]|uniref:Chitobiase/beta-hexosaminidase C-terminal domain-containing protein n=1 Tax=Clostridium tertium TaxID=1559 RepID=A0A9X3XM96_9CLOT|nr:chitobiase/beta-hexosaminidase C-terminal domain-containing protein [Clostridium tertium]MDC4241950.1 chitobiase/beta-hexosaminidase C-terminal domain-containing protein [Clostridium tertium]